MTQRFTSTEFLVTVKVDDVSDFGQQVVGGDREAGRVIKESLSELSRHTSTSAEQLHHTHSHTESSQVIYTGEICLFYSLNL